MATATQNWLGQFSFDTTADKTSSTRTGIGVLECGLYKATVKNAIMGVLGAKDTRALIVTYELEDNGKAITQNLWLNDLAE